MSHDEITDTDPIINAINELTNAVKESTAAADRRHAEWMKWQKRFIGALERQNWKA